MSSIFLSTDNVSKVRLSGKQRKTVLDSISLYIKRGEIIALLGANGAGKTTLSSLIASIYPPTSGDVLFEGRSIYRDICAYRQVVGYCPQKINLDNDLTVERNLQCAGRYMGLSQAVSQDRVEESIERYGLHRYRKSMPGTLSGGYARRVLLARALMHNPQLLILDEPTVGLDPHIRRQLWDTIRSLKERGVTIILTTHYLDEAEFLADRVCVLEHGKIRMIDTPAGLKAAYHKSNLEEVFIQLLKEEAQS